MQWRDFLLALDLVWRVPAVRVQRIFEAGHRSPESVCEEARSQTFEQWREVFFPRSHEATMPRKKAFFFWLQGLEEKALQTALDPWRVWWEEQGLCVTTRCDPEYPARFLFLDIPPISIWWSRRPRWKSTLPIAVVGSREMSEFGSRTTRIFVHEVTKTYGAAIVSGCARGVDLVAHTACLQAGGETIGFLGSGLARVSPRVHTLMQSGWIASEFPPVEPVQKWSFEQRNRLIAGLAEAVVVIEAREGSGTMLTVTAALDQGKKVFVLSQAPDSPNRAGIVALAEKGAIMISSVDELMFHLRGKESVLHTQTLLENVLQQTGSEEEEQATRYLWRKNGKAWLHEVPEVFAHFPERWHQSLAILEAKGVVVRHLGMVALSCMIQS